MPDAERPMGARTFAERERVVRQPRGICGCGEEKTVEVILQARSKSRKGSLAGRARSFCEGCALRVFEEMERELDAG